VAVAAGKLQGNMLSEWQRFPRTFANAKRSFFFSVRENDGKFLTAVAWTSVLLVLASTILASCFKISSPAVCPKVSL